MDTAAVVGAILRVVNDETVVRPYGDGLLVDLPLTYHDGDSVRVLVEPMGSGFRVSDRAVATTAVAAAGVNLRAGRPADALADVVLSLAAGGLTPGDGELAVFGPVERLGRMVLDVAQAAIRVDQLRWLAVRQTSRRFTDRVIDRVRLSAGNRTVQRDARVTLKSGRQRSITVRVSDERQSAYVQAVSSREQEQSAEHCFYLYSLSDIPPEHRIAALDGGRADWPEGIIAELASVTDVEFFGDPSSLERRIDTVVPDIPRSDSARAPS